VIAVDTNVLVAAHRAEHSRHASAHARLVALAEGDAPWGLPFVVLSEFVRVVTHPRVFRPPSDLDTAVAFIDRLLESPTVRLMIPGADPWSYLRDALRDGDARGSLAFDAQIAALCLEGGAGRLLSFDRDFRRFSQLVLEPLE
jgi:toxin-antitoxin system PIN domain toxin